MIDEKTLRDEASMWFARMRGPEAAEHRLEFEQWIAGDWQHRLTYKRLEDGWRDAAILARSTLVQHELAALSEQTKRHVIPRWAVAAMVAIGFIGTLSFVGRPWNQTADRMASVTAPTTAIVPFETKQGEVRIVELSDGSSVMLDEASKVSVMFTTSDRLIRLDAGKGRFVVAHDNQRPFVVMAGSSSITALGTIFDVSIRKKEEVYVALIQGSVDVAKTGEGQKNKATARRLKPGQSIAFAQTQPIPVSRNTNPEEMAWPTGLVEIDGVRVGVLVEGLNRLHKVQVTTSDPSLDGCRVSGIFRLDNPIRLAENIADLCNFRVNRSTSGIIKLSKSPN